MPVITRFLSSLILFTLVGCGGGETPKGNTQNENSEGDPLPTNVPQATKVGPPPSDLVQDWSGAGATVGRLKLNPWNTLDFDGRKVPQTVDDILAFAFDDFNPDNLEKISPPESPFAILIDKANDKSLDVLARFDTLQVLHLTRCRVSDAGLAKIAKIPGLQQLTLVKENVLDPEEKDVSITDQGLRTLAGMKNLERLRLTGYRTLNDSAFTALGGASKLTGLAFIEMPSIGGGGLKGLSGFKNLRDLDLSSTATRDLKEMDGLTKMVTLRLANCKGVSDAGFTSIVKMTNLQRLDLAYTSVTDAGISKLSSLKKLRGLATGGCPGVTPGSITALRKGNPHLLPIK